MEDNTDMGEGGSEELHQAAAKAGAGGRLERSFLTHSHTHTHRVQRSIQYMAPVESRDIDRVVQQKGRFRAGGHGVARLHGI